MRHFTMETFNGGLTVRLTDPDTDLSVTGCVYNTQGDSDALVQELKIKLKDRVENESERLKRIHNDPVSFSEAIHEVLNNGKGMTIHITVPDHPNHSYRERLGDAVIRAQYPDDNSKMQSPYLYAEDKITGCTPWTIDVSAPFALWRIVD